MSGWSKYHSKYKTKLCPMFQNRGNCSKLDDCTFAHGAAELRYPGESSYTGRRQNLDSDLRLGRLCSPEQRPSADRNGRRLQTSSGHENPRPFENQMVQQPRSCKDVLVQQPRSYKDAPVQQPRSCKDVLVQQPRSYKDVLLKRVELDVKMLTDDKLQPEVQDRRTVGVWDPENANVKRANLNGLIDEIVEVLRLENCNLETIEAHVGHPGSIGSRFRTVLEEDDRVLFKPVYTTEQYIEMGCTVPSQAADEKIDEFLEGLLAHWGEYIAGIRLDEPPKCLVLLGGDSGYIPVLEILGQYMDIYLIFPRRSTRRVTINVSKKCAILDCLWNGDFRWMYPHEVSDVDLRQPMPVGGVDHPSLDGDHSSPPGGGPQGGGPRGGGPQGGGPRGGGHSGGEPPGGGRRGGGPPGGEPPLPKTVKDSLSKICEYIPHVLDSEVPGLAEGPINIFLVMFRITSSTKKFVKEYNHFLRAQDDLKRSEARLQKLGSQLSLYLSENEGNDRDANFDIVSDEEESGRNPGIASHPHNELQNTSSGSRKRHYVDQYTSKETVEAVIGRGEEEKVEKRPSRWNTVPSKSYSEEESGAWNGEDTVNKSPSMEGKWKRRRFSSGNSSTDKVMSSTSMAVRAFDEIAEFDEENPEAAKDSPVKNLFLHPHLSEIAIIRETMRRMVTMA